MKETKCIRIYDLDLYFNIKGEYKNCCYQDQESYRTFEGFEKLQKAPLIADIREKMNIGEEHSSCQHCYNFEHQGIESPRQNLNQNFLEKHQGVFPDTYSNKPRELYIRFSNLCNFSCRMCSTYASTARRDLDEKIFGESIWLRELPSEIFQYFYDVELLKNLEVIDIKWGEPFLHKQHFHFLDFLIQNGLSHHIELKYNTNLSILPGYDWKNTSLIPEGYKDIFDMWKQFKQILVRVSLEWYGEENNYIRIWADWKEIENNIDILSHYWFVRTIITATIQPDNLLYIPKLIFFAQQKNLLLNIWSHSFVYEPKFYDVRILPPEIKKYIEKFYEICLMKYSFSSWYRQNIQDILTYMNSWKYDRVLFKEYLRVTKITDNLYNLRQNNTLIQIIEKIFPSIHYEKV